MGPQALEVMSVFLGVSTVGTLLLIGYKMHLSAKLGLKKGTHEVNDVVEQLEDQVRVLRDEVGDLRERMDFAERLLTSGRQEREPSQTPV